MKFTGLLKIPNYLETFLVDGMNAKECERCGVYMNCQNGVDSNLGYMILQCPACEIVEIL